MKTKVLFQKGILALLLSVSFFTNAQIVVDNNIGTNASYNDLQVAIDAASNNDVIYVQPSATTYGNITIEKPLTIIGRSHSEPSKIATIGTITINPSGSNTNLRGLKFSSLNITGVNGTSSGGVITPPILVENIVVERCNPNSISFGSVYSYGTNGSVAGSSNVILRGNYLGSINGGYVTNLNVSHNIISSFISIRRPDTTVLTNNIFLNDNIFNAAPSIGNVLIQNSMFLSNTSIARVLSIDDAQLDNCLTYNFGTGSYAISTTTETMSTSNMLENIDPMFTQIDLGSSNLFSIENDYTLQGGSPAIGAGVNSEDIGIFGSNYNYNNVGNPLGYPIINIITSSAAVPENGNLSVTISAKSQ